MKKKNIVDEFIEATPIWIDALKRIEELTGNDCCTICGARHKKIKELLEVVKELKEKALMYDKLCK